MDAPPPRKTKERPVEAPFMAWTGPAAHELAFDRSVWAASRPSFLAWLRRHANVKAVATDFGSNSAECNLAERSQARPSSARNRPNYQTWTEFDETLPALAPHGAHAPSPRRGPSQELFPPRRTPMRLARLRVHLGGPLRKCSADEGVARMCVCVCGGPEVRSQVVRS